MPDVLPTINNEPAQGIQALLDTTYLWNPDVANDLIEQINALLEKLDGVTNSIPPYSELEAPVKQYQPCYNGDNVYVAAADIETLPATFDPAQWILIATKAPVLQAGAGIDINGNEISVEQQVLSDAAAGGTAVQPEDLATVATSGSYNDLSNKPTIPAAQVNADWDANSGVAQILNKPTLGTAAAASTTDFATAAQGALADTAIQPADLATVATSGSYTDLSNKPAIDGVTLTSQTTKADIGLAGVYKYKGSVATYADLANIQNPDVGDVYNVEDTGDNYAWSGTEWDQLGGVFVPPVTSVNSKTGAVVLSAEDVGATPQYATMPTAGATNAGEIVQFTGATGATYTNGFFYKNLQTTNPAATVSQTSGSGFTSLAIDVDYFVEHQQPTGDETIDLTIIGVDAPELVSTSTITGNLEFEVDPVAFNTFIEGLYNGTPFETATVNLTYDGSNWAVTSGNITLWVPGMASTEMEYSPLGSLASVGITVTGGSVTQGTEIQVELYGTFVFIEIGNLTNYGVTWKGTPEVDSVVTIVYTESSTTYAWTRVDVQPAPDPLPSQTGHSGEFLTTNGTSASWTAVDALPDQTGQSGKFLTTDGSSASWSDKPLVNNTANNGGLAILGSVGNTFTTSVGVGAQANGNSSTAYGNGAKANGEDSTAIGRNSQVVSSGANGRRSVAIGANAIVNGGRYGIQLGTGTNNEAGTFYVGLGQGTTEYNYKLLDSDGTIPSGRLADTTSTQQGDILALDSNGDAQWTAGTTITFRTWGANE